MTTFDYLFKEMIREEPWLTYGLKGELLQYLKCKDNEVNDIFWMVKNGYNKGFIRNAIQKITGKTTEELDTEYTLNTTYITHQKD
jgi:hypothetical protein